MKLWVIAAAGVLGKIGREATQKVTMQLVPRSRGQGSTVIPDRERSPAHRGGSPLVDTQPTRACLTNGLPRL